MTAEQTAERLKRVIGSALPTTPVVDTVQRPDALLLLIWPDPSGPIPFKPLHAALRAAFPSAREVPDVPGVRTIIAPDRFHVEHLGIELIVTIPRSRPTTPRSGRLIR